MSNEPAEAQLQVRFVTKQEQWVFQIVYASRHGFCYNFTD